MSSEATCAELDTLFDPSLLPGGGTDAEIDGLIGTVGTLPDRASENLKDAIPAVVEIAKIMLTDAKNDTRELDKHMEEPGVSDRYLNAAESISTVCYPVESIQPGESTDTGEIAEGEEPFEGEVVEAEEIPAG